MDVSPSRQDERGIPLHVDHAAGDGRRVQFFGGNSLHDELAQFGVEPHHFINPDALLRLDDGLILGQLQLADDLRLQQVHRRREPIITPLRTRRMSSNAMMLLGSVIASVSRLLMNEMGTQRCFLTRGLAPPHP